MPETPPAPPRRPWESKWAKDFDPTPRDLERNTPIPRIFFDSPEAARRIANNILLRLQLQCLVAGAIGAFMRLNFYYFPILMMIGLFEPISRGLKPFSTLPPPGPGGGMEIEKWDELRSRATRVQATYLAVGLGLTAVIAVVKGAGASEVTWRLLLQAAMGYSLMRMFPSN